MRVEKRQFAQEFSRAPVKRCEGWWELTTTDWSNAQKLSSTLIKIWTSSKSMRVDERWRSNASESCNSRQLSSWFDQGFRTREAKRAHILVQAPCFSANEPKSMSGYNILLELRLGCRPCLKRILSIFFVLFFRFLHYIIGLTEYLYYPWNFGFWYFQDLRNEWTESWIIGNRFISKKTCPRLIYDLRSQLNKERMVVQYT